MGKRVKIKPGTPIRIFDGRSDPVNGKVTKCTNKQIHVATGELYGDRVVSQVFFKNVSQWTILKSIPRELIRLYTPDEIVRWRSESR